MGPITVFFRFDDYSQTSPEEVERPLVEALRRTGTCATFAVIPAVTSGRYHDPGDRANLRLEGEKLRFLREAATEGVVEVALHGWNHRSQSSQPPHGEFIRIDRGEQLARLQRGQQCFAEAGLEHGVFVPPWNAYDASTIGALADAKIQCLSANRYGPALPGALAYLPITVDLNGLRSAVTDARQSGDPDPIIGVLLHPYDFEESGDRRAITNIRKFEEDLRWLGAQPDVRIDTIGRIARTNPTLGLARYAANQPLPFESVFPPFLRRTSETPFLRSADRARRAKVFRALAVIATYAGAATVSGSAAHLVWQSVPVDGLLLATGARLTLSALLVAVLARSVLNRAVYFRGMLALSALAGMCVALWR